MDRIVCYIPSYNDSQQTIESLATSTDWDVVISDNHSAADHAQALAAAASAAGSRVELIRQPMPLGRVGNWRFCVEHFIASGATWMTFLSAGDRHRPDSLAIFRRAIVRNWVLACKPNALRGSSATAAGSSTAQAPRWPQRPPSNRRPIRQSCCRRAAS